MYKLVTGTDFLMTSYLISTLDTAEVSGETLILHQRKKMLICAGKSATKQPQLLHEEWGGLTYNLDQIQ